METITNGRHTFEIVEEVPDNFYIWNIGKNMVEGYLPLCELRKEQELEGGMEIKTSTLKAIKIKDAQVILAAMGYGPKNIEEMEQFIEDYKNNKDSWQYQVIDNMKKALPIMKTIKGL